MTREERREARKFDRRYWRQRKAMLVNRLAWSDLRKEGFA